MRSIVMKVIAFSCIALITGCERNDIFEKPQVGSPKLPPKPLETSYITLAINMPFSAIQKAIDTNVPSEQSFQGNGEDLCADVPALKIKNVIGLPAFAYIGFDKKCAEYNWSATARKSGPVTVSNNGDAMRVAVPLDINGKAGLKGELARLLSLTGKNFAASVKPIVDIKVAIGTDWCPHINATPTQDWVSKASVEIIGQSCAGIDLGPLGKPRICVGPVNLDLTSQANSAVNGQQDAIKNTAANAINCAQLRQSIQAQWKPIVVPVDASEENPLFLNIMPQSLAFSNIKATDSALQFAVKAGVKAQLDGKAISTEVVPMPPLGPVTVDSSNLHIVVRANVDYTKIADALKASVVGKRFTAITPAGDVSVTAENVEIFPSNGKIAVGVKITATLPGRYFDTNGWVYMTAIPTVTQSGTAVELSKLNYSTVLDNKLWQALVAIFDNQIIQEIRKNSKIDLQRVISKSSQDLATKINSTSIPGVRINAEQPIAKLIDVAIDSTALVATASAEMKFSVMFTDGIVPEASK